VQQYLVEKANINKKCKIYIYFFTLIFPIVFTVAIQVFAPTLNVPVGT